jgi:hypothetical protein
MKGEAVLLDKVQEFIVGGASRLGYIRMESEGILAGIMVYNTTSPVFYFITPGDVGNPERR